MRNYYDKLRAQKDEYDNQSWVKKQKHDGSLVNVNVNVNYYCDQTKDRRFSPDMSMLPNTPPGISPYIPMLPNTPPDMMLDESMPPNALPDIIPNTQPTITAYSPAPQSPSSL